MSLTGVLLKEVHLDVVTDGPQEVRQEGEDDELQEAAVRPLRFVLLRFACAAPQWRIYAHT